MVSDGHRGLELSYNFLNLPSRIRIKDSTSLVYSYLSDGTMVSVKDSVSGNGLRFRGSFVYTVSPGKSFDKVTVLDKLSLAGTFDDLVTFILNWLKQDEDEAEDEEDIKDLYGLN